MPVVKGAPWPAVGEEWTLAIVSALANISYIPSLPSARLVRVIIWTASRGHPCLLGSPGLLGIYLLNVTSPTLWCLSRASKLVDSLVLTPSNPPPPNLPWDNDCLCALSKVEDWQQVSAGNRNLPAWLLGVWFRALLLCLSRRISTRHQVCLLRENTRKW